MLIGLGLGYGGIVGAAGEDRELVDDADTRDAERYWTPFVHTA